MLFPLLLQLNVVSFVAALTEVYIEPVNGGSCFNMSSCFNITSFGKMAPSYAHSSNLVVYFLEGTHLLIDPLEFINLSNATFKGLGVMKKSFDDKFWQSSVVISFDGSIDGIAFNNGRNITIEMITFENCDEFAYNALNFNSVDRVKAFKLSVLSRCSLSVKNCISDLVINSSSFAYPFIMDSGIFISFDDNIQKSTTLSTYRVIISNVNLIHGVKLAIELTQTSYGLSIVLDNVYVDSNDITSFGYGRIDVTLATCIPYYNLTITNTVVHGGTGLGINIGDLSPKYCNQTAMKKPSITIANSNFTNNVFISYVKAECVSIRILKVENAPELVIKSIIISGTYGFGSSLVLYQLTMSRNYLWDVSLIDVVIKKNVYNGPSGLNTIAIANFFGYFTVPMAAIRVDTVSSLRLSNILITDNTLTGLMARDTMIFVTSSSNSSFINNTGQDGGAIALYGQSYLVFEYNSQLEFTSNHVEGRGGAIFVEQNNFHTTSIFCPFQYHGKNRRNSPLAIFSGNKAKKGGDVIYGETYTGCYDTFATSAFNIDDDFNFTGQYGSSVLSSDPTHVCHCNSANVINWYDTSITLSGYPGEDLLINIAIVSGPVPSAPRKSGITTGFLEIRLNGVITNILTQKFDSVSCQEVKFRVNCLEIPNSLEYIATVYGYTTFEFTISVNVNKCPTGLKLDNKTGYCVCVDFIRAVSSSVKCNESSVVLTHLNDSVLWIGLDNTTILRGTCPLDYCTNEQVDFTLFNTDPQCALNRTGVLCGRCEDGLSLVLGSNSCKQCPDSSFLALVIPFAIAGVGLVVLLLLLNLTVSTGTINGLIVYANVIKQTQNIKFQIPVLSQFISWLNLDLGIETCFYNGMTAYVKVGLQFVFPVYIWFIIATIIVLCRYSVRLSRLVGGNVVQVLATLILLSYTKLFRAIILALKSTLLSCDSGSDRLVWFVNGNVGYLSTWEHILLFIIALVFLLLGVLFTLALLLQSLVNKYLTKLRLVQNRWSRMKPLLDAYNGPYKDSCHIWTGLLLLTRLVLVSVSSSLTTSTGIHIAVTTSTVLLLSLIMLFKGLYKKRILDLLEFWCFFNLFLLSYIMSVHTTGDVTHIATIVSLTLIFATFIAVVIYHSCLQLMKINVFNKIAANICKKVRYKRKSYQELEGIETDSAMATPCVTTSEVALKRESLIESIVNYQ